MRRRRVSMGEVITPLNCPAARFCYTIRRNHIAQGEN